MATELEIGLAKAEAIKRFRAAIRLEMAIAGDYVIGRNLPKIKEMMQAEIDSGGLPALESGVGSKAKKIADELQEYMDSLLQKELGSGDDSA